MRQRKNVDVSSTNNNIKNNLKIPKTPKNNKFTHPLLNNNVFYLCLFFRFINAFFVQTYFNPDEHWQALEVAHHISFGFVSFSQFLKYVSLFVFRDSNKYIFFTVNCGL